MEYFWTFYWNSILWSYGKYIGKYFRIMIPVVTYYYEKREYIKKKFYRENILQIRGHIDLSYPCVYVIY